MTVPDNNTARQSISQENLSFQKREENASETEVEPVEDLVDEKVRFLFDAIELSKLTVCHSKILMPCKMTWSLGNSKDT
jgi:hypothetical protein